MSDEEQNNMPEEAGQSDVAEAVVDGEGAESAEFSDIEAEEPKVIRTEEENLELILDIPVQISVEIGRTYMNIRNLLQLNQGSVVELDRMAGEPLDIMVNGTLIAHGEVVVVNEKFGVRLTDIMSAADRIKKLK